MKALLLTRRTRIPASIRQCLNAGASTFVVTEVTGGNHYQIAESIRRHIRYSAPTIIAIDGEYGATDAAAWTQLSKLDPESLRLRILSDQGLPKSLELLKIAHAVKGNLTGVVIFIEKPSDTLRTELRRIGALWVWPTLNKPTGLESSFYKIITGIHRFTAGFKDLIDVAVGEITGKK